MSSPECTYCGCLSEHSDDGCTACGRPFTKVMYGRLRKGTVFIMNSRKYCKISSKKAVFVDTEPYEYASNWTVKFGEVERFDSEALVLPYFQTIQEEKQ